MEPRAGFDPATNSLRGCRSTGLSHRGVCSELSEIHVFKTFGRKQPHRGTPKTFCSIIEIKMCLCVIRCWVTTASKSLCMNLSLRHPFCLAHFFFIFRKYRRATPTIANTPIAAAINVIGKSAVSSVSVGISASSDIVK